MRRLESLASLRLTPGGVRLQVVLGQEQAGSHERGTLQQLANVLRVIAFVPEGPAQQFTRAP